MQGMKGKPNMNNSEKTLDKIVALCKGRGFVYPGSEIYGGLANTWDYGPLGVELKTNIKAAWRKKFIQENKYNVGLDSAILMNPQTWVASGHVGGFSDPLMDCKDCKTRHRADKLIEDFGETDANGWTNEQMMTYIREKDNTFSIGHSDVMVIANQIKEVPAEYINERGNNVTDECCRYLLPLIRGEAYPHYTDGIPEFLVI